MQTDTGGLKGTASNFNHSVGVSTFITPAYAVNLIPTLKVIICPHKKFQNHVLLKPSGAWGSVVVKALRY